MMKQQQSEQTNKLVALRNVLRNYRWTPHTTTGTPPAEALFRRSIRTELARLKSSSTKFKTKNPKYNIGQMIWMRHHQRNKRLEWKSGIIKPNIGSMMYEIMLIDGQTHIRHQNQLRSRQEPYNKLNDLEYLPDVLLSGSKSSIQLEIPAQQTPRYPSRHRKPPDRYTPT